MEPMMHVAHRIFFAVIGSIDDDWHSDYLREAQVTEKTHLAAGFSLMLPVSKDLIARYLVLVE